MYLEKNYEYKIGKGNAVDGMHLRYNRDKVVVVAQDIT